VGLSLYSPVVARQLLGKHNPAAMDCWRRHFLCGPWCIKGEQAISSSQNFL
jgi:hypothetical protein